MPNYAIRLMSPERLAVKRAHAELHPDGRTAELIGHIDALEAELDQLRRDLDDCRGALAETETAGKLAED